uniref:SREBP regulating gene protein n=1 Tax=Polytomella parva TaxID=51329 RepID=A0A7S0VP30_9CHLO|mmetsp:Transcript_8292/g.15978  ORF Transcript_8292/g.15978 Transcript_8292/m.15978 type:complete len:308 (+) Transcript_8292:65-988(+)
MQVNERFLLILALLLCLGTNFARGRPQSQQHICNNTRSGRDYLADNQGYLCQREDFNYDTGCCSSGKRYDCSFCSPQDSCCSVYEGCVSCCLRSDKHASRRFQTTSLYASAVVRKNFTTPFDFCMSICRTHPLSTAHENNYVSNRHHCFSNNRRPMVEKWNTLDSLKDVVVVAGDESANCNSACAKVRSRAPDSGIIPSSSSIAPNNAISVLGRFSLLIREEKEKKFICSEKHMKLMSSCDLLREHFACEAGCTITPSSEGTMSGYVVSSAGKEKRPAFCFKARNPESQTCSQSENRIRRVCPCVEA